ncbi:MAG: demethoxyubiquinone hydroxylase family protein [Rubrivivax sp.]|jgi:ubiquinone biosynthesis monooxygenase Coq7
MSRFQPAGHATTPSAEATTASLTVYFDGQCPVCSREVALYRRQAGAESCHWVDASECAPSALGEGLGREQALARMHVRRADGELVSGAQAFAALWQALPSMRRWGQLAGWRPLNAVLELAYRMFLRLRPLWRPDTSFERWLAAELRSDHAGETGAIEIYRGILAVSRDADVRRFAEQHLATEQRHLVTLESVKPAVLRSRLLVLWRPAGWLTGALPALAGPRAVYATIAAVERFVDGHYAQQISRIDQELGRADAGAAGGLKRQQLSALRETLARCRDDELQHRDEALAAGPATGWMAAAWARVVGSGSAAAVVFARRF